MSDWSPKKLKRLLVSVGEGAGHKLTNFRLEGSDENVMLADCELCGEKDLAVIRKEEAGATLVALPQHNSGECRFRRSN